MDSWPSSVKKFYYVITMYIITAALRSFFVQLILQNDYLKGVPNPLQHIPRLHIAAKKSLDIMFVYSHSYWLVFFCTTNGSRVLMKERWQTFENSWKKTQYLMNTLYQHIILIIHGVNTTSSSSMTWVYACLMKLIIRRT